MQIVFHIQGMEHLVFTYLAHKLNLERVLVTYPHEGTTVTRNQDVCTNGGSLASINSTEGVLYAEVAAFSR